MRVAACGGEQSEPPPAGGCGSRGSEEPLLVAGNLRRGCSRPAPPSRGGCAGCRRQPDQSQQNLRGIPSRSSIARDDATFGCSRLRPAPPAAAEGNFNGTDIATHSDHSFSPQTIRRSEAALTGAVPEGTDPFKKTYRSPQRKPVHTTATNKSFKHLPSTISHLHCKYPLNCIYDEFD